MPLLAVIFVIVSIYACAIYANLSFAVTKPADYRYFPPFRPGVNRNMNRHLGAEYYNIAKAMVKGEGFANPFWEQTGPTAWMAPVLPCILAIPIWASGGNEDVLMMVFIFLQVTTLIATGLLVLALARRTTRRGGTFLASLLFLGAVLCHFHLCFQFTHDCWVILLAVDLLVAGFCWLRPLRGWKTAGFWGLVGGFCALINPVTGFVWGVMSFVLAIRQRAWLRFGVAVFAAGLALAPWTVRNYRVFGRFIPVKSNLAYELYQSQCLQSDGLIQEGTFGSHPYASSGREREEYKALGEMKFLDQKREQFWRAFEADPADFLDRAANRFLGTTVWYVPYDRTGEPRQRPWTYAVARWTHPLPFVGLVILMLSSFWKPLHPAQWSVMGIYVLYLLPYAAVSYYDRYGLPLIGVKVLLVIWGIDRLLFWRRKQAPAKEEPTLIFQAIEEPTLNGAASRAIASEGHVPGAR
jgi:hypothetical protein